MTMDARKHHLLPPSATLAPVLALVVFLASAVGVDAATRTLTRSGQLASLQLEETADHEVLALNLDGITYVVPTGDAGATITPLFLLDSVGGALNAVWTVALDGGYVLRSATLSPSAGGWTWEGPHVLTARGAELFFPDPPKVSISEDRLRVELEDGQAFDLERQILHVVWQVEDGAIRYTPQIFEGGHYAGWNEIITLSSALQAARRQSAMGGGAGDLILDGVRDAGDGKSLLITLVDDGRQHIATLRLETEPLLLKILGDAVFDQILAVADLFDPQDPDEVADVIRGHIIHVGARLNLEPAVGDLLSSRIGGWLQANSSTFGWDLEALAAATRLTTLDIGRSVYTLTVQDTSGEGPATVIDIRDFLDDGGHRDELARLVQVQVASDFALPAALPENTRFHVSSDGTAVAAVVADAAAGTLRWIENRGQGWSAVRKLSLGADLGVDEANALVIRSLR